MRDIGLFGPSDAETLRIQVFGMACEHCQDTVESVLADQEGVHSARVSLDGREALVEADPALEPEILLETVRGVGYEARLA